ncbi:hypothetical protein [Streptococcus salivarius]|uniref:hypothetical protein n=1 Tax=Streptococcus salivarius TaxID=1304 RepID=UPI001D122E2B|nr:hypothetical protein [Streptococcus salivarius]
MIKKILRFPSSKRGRIYTATLLTLFFLGNAYVKHKYHEKAVEELQTALKADKVTEMRFLVAAISMLPLVRKNPLFIILKIA